MATDHDPLDAFVDAVLQSYGQLALIIDHMLRASAHAPPGAESMPAVLHGLLRDTLEPLARRRGDLDVAVAAELLAAATDAIGEDVFLVPIDPPNGRPPPL